jgi:hypothetical protein
MHGKQARCFSRESKLFMPDMSAIRGENSRHIVTNIHKERMIYCNEIDG